MSFGYQILGFGSGGSAGPYDVDFLVVAGGGGGGCTSNGGPQARGAGGGGGAGGYRTLSTQEVTPGNDITVTVGAGAAGKVQATVEQSTPGGVSSIASDDFSTMESAGGGSGGSHNATGQASPYYDIFDGGSGAGMGSSVGEGGDGNVPSTDPSQGNDGGDGISISKYIGGGGGGHAAAGTNAAGNQAGVGGAGTANTITGASVYYAGGAGAGANGCYAGSQQGAGTPSTGGGGGGGANNTIGTAGTANTGGGGGGSGGQHKGTPNAGGAGGSGVVILKVPTSSYTGTTTGSPTVTTSGDYTIVKYTSSGTYTA